MADPAKIGLVFQQRQQQQPVQGGAPSPFQQALQKAKSRKYTPLSMTNRDAAFKAGMAKQAASNDTAPRSLFEQFSDSFTGIFSGLPKLGMTVAKQSMAVPRVLFDAARGDANAADVATTFGNATNPFGTQASRHVMGTDQFESKDYNPLYTEWGNSNARTLGNFRHPSRYLDAIEEGRIVDAVVEDASNVAMVAGPAAKALGASAEAATAAGRARSASVLGGAEKAVTALETPLRTPVRAFGKGMQAVPGMGRPGAFVEGLTNGNVVRNAAGATKRGLQASFDSALAAGEGTARRGLAQAAERRFPLLLTDAGKAGRENANWRALHGERVTNNLQHDLHAMAVEGGYSAAEEGVALARINGVAAGDQLLIDQLGLTPDQARNIHQLHNLPEQTFTPEIQQLDAEIRNGTADPEVVARVQALTDGTLRHIDTLQTQRLAGDGALGGPLDVRQMGDDVLDERVATVLAEQGVDARTVGAINTARANGMSWDAIRQVVPEVDQILDSDFTVYPAPWRPMMRQMALARQAEQTAAALTASMGMPAAPARSIPFTPNDLLDAGMERPRYLPGGESDLFTPRQHRLVETPTNRGLGGVRGMSSEKLRAAADTQPYSLRVLGEKLGDQWRTMIGNEATMNFVNDPRVPRVSQLIDDPTMQRYMAEAQREAAITHPTDLAKQAEFAQAAYGNKVIRDLSNRGYDVLAGDPVNPQAGDYSPDGQVDARRVDADSIVLPKGVRNKLKTRTASPLTNVPHEVLSYINKKFKGAVLPFSLRWQMGDLVGGAFMSTVGGGIPPWELVQSMQDLKNLSPDAQRSILKHGDFTDRGLTMQELDWRSPNGTAIRPDPKTPFGKFQRKSFEFNNAINHYNRSGYLLARVQRTLEKYGLGNVDAVDNAGAWDQPDVQRALDEAVADANKVMGAFDAMTPFERRWVREVFPFYAWTRHITTLAWRTAIDNPARIMWTMRLGQIGTDPEEDVPDWLRGSLPVPDALMPDFMFGEGDGLLSTQFINPFNDVMNTPGWTPAGMARSLSPGIKVPMALLGLEPNPRDNINPIRPITRPYGADRNPFTDALYSGLQSFPITREAINMAPTTEIGPIGLGPHPRYHSGQLMVDGNGDPIDSSSRTLIPFRLAGVPLPANADDAQAILEAQRKRAKVQKAKTNKVRIGL